MESVCLALCYVRDLNNALDSYIYWLDISKTKDKRKKNILFSYRRILLQTWLEAQVGGG